MPVDIGIDVGRPETSCEDVHCPFHGMLKVRGQIIEGKVTSDKREKTVSVERDYYRYINKYQRYEKRRSKLSAHSPECIGAKIGDSVKIMECRSLGKGKSFVVIAKQK